MKLILAKPVNNLGPRGAIIEVADGYARNFLLPRGLAIAFADSLAPRLLHAAKTAKRFEIKGKAGAEKVASALAGRKFELAKRAGEKGSLYSAVRLEDVAKLISQALGFVVRSAELSSKVPLKRVGEFDVEYRHHGNITPFQIIIRRDSNERKK